MTTGQYHIRPGYILWGMCYDDNTLFALERPRFGDAYSLSAYSLRGENPNLTQIDTISLGCRMSTRRGAWWPRVDPHEHLVYVPCEHHGVLVIKWTGEKMVKTADLKCVTSAVAVAVVSRHFLYVADETIGTVYLVDTKADRIKTRLEVPETPGAGAPYRLATLGDTLLVWYGDYAFPNSNRLSPSLTNLVMYKHGTTSPVKLLQAEGLRHLEGLSTDNYSKFLLTDRFEYAVFVMDATGDVCQKIPRLSLNTQIPIDCFVSDGQLFVGCENGSIFVQSNR